MKTLVLGASENIDRYSNKAIRSLLQHGHEVVAIGARSGKVQEVKIEVGMPLFEGVDTVTIYLNPVNQEKYYDYLMALHPRRLIFNPGAENPSLQALALEKGIVSENACTLVLLSTDQY